MVWDFVSPAPHPKYVHPNGTTDQFFHLWENQHFGQNFFKTPYVPKGCTYWSDILGRKTPVPKVSFDVLFGSRNFSKFYSPFLREFGPKGRFGTHFRRVIKFVLEMLYSKYEYSEGFMGRLTGFGGRCAPNMICGHQAHPWEGVQKIAFFRRFFSSGVPFGCNTL